MIRTPASPNRQITDYPNRRIIPAGRNPRAAGEIWPRCRPLAIFGAPAAGELAGNHAAVIDERHEGVIAEAGTDGITNDAEDGQC